MCGRLMFVGAQDYLPPKSNPSFGTWRNVSGTWRRVKKSEEPEHRMAKRKFLKPPVENIWFAVFGIIVARNAWDLDDGFKRTWRNVWARNHVLKHGRNARRLCIDSGILGPLCCDNLGAYVILMLRLWLLLMMVVVVDPSQYWSCPGCQP